MHIPRMLKLPNKKKNVEMESKQQGRRKPRLDRRNAIKNIDYAAPPPSYSPDNSSSSLRTQSLDLPNSYAGQTSFRVEGIEEGEFDRICRDLGLSGPDDFAIPAAAWEARKIRSSSDLLPRSRLQQSDSSNSGGADERSPREEEDLATEFWSRVRVSEEFPNAASSTAAGIKGIRPPFLAPPPPMSLPVLDKGCSTWDMLRSLAPDNDVSSSPIRDDYEDDKSEEEDEEITSEVVGAEERSGVRLGETDILTGSSSFSTSNDDDSSSTNTDVFVISPNGRFKRNIKSWTRGGLLGSGSFGTVYEGLSDDGFFFAVKEVSLLDQGSQAQQCIHQLEQEIALLSQFEHENIVPYLGTDKEEAKLYIFLELMTKGSLVSLYQKYHLRDSQVSAYTRQILNGLKYLHDRNVVHRDIKCANILADASGSVKLADFGLAKETSKLNMLKSCKGSAFWMAPEVVNPRKKYGLAADIWSLGCTVLELLTRQPPYSHLEWTQALFKIGRGVPPPIPNSLSMDARDFINQCLQVEPNDRPSASELLGHPFVRRSLPATVGSVSSTNSDRGI